MATPAVSLDPVAWDVARKLAVRVGGHDPLEESYLYASLGADFREFTAQAEELVAQETGLRSLAGPARARVTDRPGWIEANVASFRRLLRPLTERLGEMRFDAVHARADERPTSMRLGQSREGVVLTASRLVDGFAEHRGGLVEMPGAERRLADAHLDVGPRLERGRQRGDQVLRLAEVAGEQGGGQSFELQVGRRLETRVEGVPRRPGRRRHQLGPTVDQPVGRARHVGDLERDPQPRRDPAADLDVVDHLDLGAVGQLERRAADVQDRHLLPALAVHLELLGRAEHVAVEPDRLVVVAGLDHQSHLQHAHLHGPLRRGTAGQCRTVLSMTHRSAGDPSRRGD